MQNPNKVGLVFGKIIGGLHLLWSVVIFLGLGQSWVNFVSGLHMITPPIIVLPFDLTTAVMLIVITSVIGYALGYIGASVWNWVHSK